MELIAASIVVVILAGLYTQRLMEYYKLKKELREVRTCNRDLSIQLQRSNNGRPPVKSNGTARPSRTIPGRRRVSRERKTFFPF